MEKLKIMNQLSNKIHKQIQITF